MKLEKVTKLLNIFNNYFYYTAKPRFINPISLMRFLNEKSAYLIIKYKYKKLFALLNEYSEKSKSTGCEYSDYLNLYLTVKNGVFKNLLECGSGMSTIVIASAIKTKHKDANLPLFISMEESDYYHKQIVDIFPDSLRKYVTFTHSIRKEDMFGEFLGSYYENIPSKMYDFMYIDGPTDRKKWNDLNTPKSFNADILRIEKSAHFVALLDQRIWTLRILKKLIPSTGFKYNVIKKVTRIIG